MSRLSACMQTMGAVQDSTVLGAHVTSPLLDADPIAYQAVSTRMLLSATPGTINSTALFSRVALPATLPESPASSISSGAEFDLFRTARDIASMSPRAPVEQGGSGRLPAAAGGAARAEERRRARSAGHGGDSAAKPPPQPPLRPRCTVLCTSEPPLPRTPLAAAEDGAGASEGQPASGGSPALHVPSMLMTAAGGAASFTCRGRELMHDSGPSSADSWRTQALFSCCALPLTRGTRSRGQGADSIPRVHVPAVVRTWYGGCFCLAPTRVSAGA